jgi:dolichol kinase
MEVGRKTFHLLTLIYLFGYRKLGYPAAMYGMAAWTVLVGTAEFARLRVPAFNRVVVTPFSPIMRKEESRRMSGMYYTSLGGLATIAAFGRSPIVVSAGLACLAFGDAAAAVFGRLLGRTKWPWADKSVEGSTACFAACLAGSVALGVPWAAAAAAAGAATIVESARVPFDDNLWIPIAGAGAAWFVC